MQDKNKFKILGDNIRRFREKENITLKELAKKTKINEHYLKKIEDGKATGMRLSHVMILYYVLNTNNNELFEGL